MECTLECAAAAEDELVAVDRLRSGLKGVLPARGIGGSGPGQREGRAGYGRAERDANSNLECYSRDSPDRLS